MRHGSAITEADLPFIRAILNAPVERRPHLVYNLRPRVAYAEWLKAFPDSRAEYIRAWVAVFEVVDAGGRAPQEHADRMDALRPDLNRHWAGFISCWQEREEADRDVKFEGIPMPTNDEQLGHGPCIICGRSTHMLHWVSRMPCSECRRVFCWECADTGVHGSLPDFRHFVLGHFSHPGYRLRPDSCPFCQQADWMSTHRG